MVLRAPECVSRRCRETYGKTIFFILTSCCSLLLVMLFLLESFCFPILKTFCLIGGGLVGTAGNSGSEQGSLKYS